MSPGARVDASKADFWSYWHLASLLVLGGRIQWETLVTGLAAGAVAAWTVGKLSQQNTAN